MGFPMWLKGLGMIVIVQQSAYSGYRMGRDDCIFQECKLPSGVLDGIPLATFNANSDRQLETTTSTVTATANTNTNASPAGAVRKGIVLTSQCSGSEWIVSSLNSVPGVTWHLERLIRYSKTYMNDAQWEAVTWKTYQADLEKAFTIPANAAEDPEVTLPKDPNKTPIMIGFKLMYDQIPQHLRLAFAQWLEENQVYVIHLRRKCAALQFASQMDKWMHKYRHQNKKDHVYTKEEAEALAKAKDWEITLSDNPGLPKNRWLESIRLLEENQQEFANYLHIYAAQAPVFEFTYESVDGPFQANWFNSLYAFLGLHHHKYTASAKTIKTGKRTCEDRMAGLGGPALPLLKATPQSRVECLRMRGLAAAGKNSTSKAAMELLGLQNVMLPPNDGRCRLGPNCRQREYGRYQDTLKIAQGN